MMLFNSMITNYLSYCNLIWCNGNKSMLINLQRAVNTFVRLLFNLNRSDNVQTVVQHSSILSINCESLKLYLLCINTVYIGGGLPLACKAMLEDNFMANITRTRCESNLPTFLQN